MDSGASEGSLKLLKAGEAQLVTHPEDIVQALETPARHLFAGTHAHRYANPSLFVSGEGEGGDVQAAPRQESAAKGVEIGLSDGQRAILGALDEPRTVDQLCIALSIDAAKMRSDITMLELRRRVVRRGTKIERVSR